jgi:hypothetical protein
MTSFETEALAAVFVFVALVLAIVALRPRSSNEEKKRYKSWERSRPEWRSPREFTSAVIPPASSHGDCVTLGMPDAGAQLNAIMKAAFQKRKVMNLSEYKVFKVVESEIAAAKNGHRAFAQTSLGQVLESPSFDAFHAINAKRVDILVVDRRGLPVFAVEYQGPGHYQGTAAARDAIKKEALRRAEVGYLEVVHGYDEEQLRLRIREHLGVTPPDPKPVGGAPKSPSRTLIRPSNAVPQLH